MIRPSGLLVCDVSSYQNPKRCNWEDPRISAVYVKFSEATGIDVDSMAHCRALREASKPLGAYHFFSPIRDAADQFAAFQRAATLNGYGPGDLIPALDVERCITRGQWCEADPSWCLEIQKLIALFVAEYGELMIYCGWATFIQLGQPSWMLERPLWVPYVSRDGNFPPAACTKSPGGKAPTLWQFMWGPLFSQIQMQTSKIAIDQSICAQLPKSIEARP